MNTPLTSTDMEIVRTASYIVESEKRIIQNLQENSRGFETFFSLLSSTVYQSSLELAEAWIYLVAKDDYEILLRPEEDMELERTKTAIRKHILRFVSEKIRIFSENPSILQQLKSRFLVLHALAHELSPTDHDRIMAKQVDVPHRTWQMMLGLFSHHPKFLEILELPATMLWQWIGDSGESGYILSVPERKTEQVSSIQQSIADIEIEIRIGAEIGITPSEKIAILPREFPVLFISETVLKRYEKVIGMEKERSAIRIAIYNRFDEISVWKKRFDTGGNNKREPIGKLVSEGI